MSRVLVVASAFALLLAGCVGHHAEVIFTDATCPANFCPDPALEIEYPDAQRCGITGNLDSLPPRRMADGVPTEFWDMTLDEAVRIALNNSEVMRDFGGRVLDLPAGVQTVFDPAITASHPRLGEEAALSAFDAQMNETFLFRASDLPFNNATQGGGAFEVQRDNFRWDYQLNKTAATGTQFGVSTFWEHDHNDAPASRFSHAWTNGMQATVRQPLLQGAGVAFNRIIGPNSRPDLALTRGVVLARINTDISLTDFERSVRDFVDQLEVAYWDLYFAYRNLDANRLARDTARETWQSVRARYDADLRQGEADQEAQAREQLYLFEQQVLQALDGAPAGVGPRGVYQAERSMRRMMGLAVNDGALIRPSEEPTEARVEFEWDTCLADALVRRVELRQQMWRVKQRELELLASRNFLLPRLDLVAAYRVEGLGDDLIGRSGSFDSAFHELGTFGHYEVQGGFQLNMPIGFRAEMAGVRHAELNLCRERAVLRDQEHQVSHELGDAIASVSTTHRNIELTYNRMVAAEQVVSARTVAFEAGKVLIEALLEAQRRLADARINYYRARVSHVGAIREVHQRRGTLLPYNGIFLTEGPSCAPACRDARQRLEHIRPRRVNYQMTKPAPVSLGPFDSSIDVTGEAPVAIACPTAPPQLIETEVVPAAEPPARPDEGPFLLPVPGEV